MTNAEKLVLKEQRLKVMLGRGMKNIEHPGVVRKLRREIRNLKVEKD